MKKIIMLFVLSILTTGCASVPKQTFNAEANKNIKTISVINPPQRNRIRVNIKNHPGSSFGLVGAAIAAADQAGKTADFNETITGKKVNWNAYSMTSLTNQLKKSGYSVNTINVRKKDDTKLEFLETYPESKADALLDYYYSVQHTATGATTDYIPTVIVYSRLIRSADKAVLYSEQFTAGNPVTGVKDAVVIPGASGYKSIALLKENADASIAELKKGVDAIATQIGKDLQR